MGIGNTTASSAIIAALSGRPAEEVTGRGTGLDEAGWRHKVAVIERALEVNRPDPNDPLGVLASTPLLGGHPATMQLPFELLVKLIGERLEIKGAYRVPAGRWTTQFGRRWPTALTPARGEGASPDRIPGRRAGK